MSLLRLYWNPSSVSQSSQISSNRDVPNCKFCEVAVQTESDQNVYTVTAGFNEYSSIEIQAKVWLASCKDISIWFIPVICNYKVFKIHSIYCYLIFFMLFRQVLTTIKKK